MTRKMRRLFAGIAAEITIGAESRGRRGEGTNKRANTGHTRGGKEAAYQQGRRQHERWHARNQWLHMEVSHEGTPKSSKLGIETHGDLGIPHFKIALYVHAYINYIYIYISYSRRNHGVSSGFFRLILWASGIQL